MTGLPKKYFFEKKNLAEFWFQLTGIHSNMNVKPVDKKIACQNRRQAYM
jgi:hypothetical protein